MIYQVCQYSVNKSIRLKTSMFRSELCDYSDVYIVVKRKANVTGTDNANRWNKRLNFKNNVQFWLCISKINHAFVVKAEVLDIPMRMHNLLKYSSNYSMTSERLWNYYRNKLNASVNENNDATNQRINNSNTMTSRSFEIKTKIIGSTTNNNSRLSAEFIVLLKNLSNFKRFLSLPLSNCEIELDLKWWIYCLIPEILIKP